MLLVTRAAVKSGICEESFTNSLQSLLLRHGLPDTCPYPMTALLPHMKSDKKRGGDEITLILPRKIGDCILHTLPLSELPALLSAEDGL